MTKLEELYAAEHDLEQRLAVLREQIREEVNYQQAHCDHEWAADPRLPRKVCSKCARTSWEDAWRL